MNDRAGFRVIVLHGAHGGPDTNWFPWLHAALEEGGTPQVAVRQLPASLGKLAHMHRASEASGE